MPKQNMDDARSKLVDAIAALIEEHHRTEPDPLLIDFILEFKKGKKGRRRVVAATYRTFWPEEPEMAERLL